MLGAYYTSASYKCWADLMLGAYYTSASYKCWADLMLGAVLRCARGCRQMQVKGLTLLPVWQISCRRWPCKPLPLRGLDKTTKQTPPHQRPGQDNKTNPSPSEAWTRPQDKPLPIRDLDKTTRQTPPPQRPENKTNPSPSDAWKTKQTPPPHVNKTTKQSHHFPCPD